MLEQSPLRDLRKCLAPVSEYMEGRKFLGKGRKKYLEDKELRREREARHIKRKMQDTKHINSSALRRARINKLQGLMQQGDSKEMVLPLIADGIAEESHGWVDENKMLCDDIQAESSELSTETQAKQVELSKLRSCYVCKVRYEKLHHFYDQLCPSKLS